MAAKHPSPSVVVTQAALNQSAAQGLAQADARLHAEATAYARRLGPEQQSLFQASQAAWDRHRRETCRFVASGVQGGSVAPMVFGQCMARHADIRLEQLRAWSTCGEGDLACPVPLRALQP